MLSLFLTNLANYNALYLHSVTISLILKFYKINNEIEYRQDKKNELTSYSIAAQSFQKINGPHANWGAQNGTYWFRLSLVNTTSEPKPIVFDIPNPQIGTAELYSDQGLVLSPVAVTGNNLKLNDRPIDSRYVALPVTLPAGKETIFYLKISFHREASIDLTVRSRDNYYLHEKTEFTKIGLYYGIVIAILIFTLLLFVNSKDHTFLLYALFLSSLSIALIIYDGLLLRFLSPGWFTDNLDWVISCAFAFTGSLFASSFLETDKYLPRFKWYTGVLLAVTFTGFFVFYITGNYIIFTIADLASLGTFAAYWIAGIILLKKHPFARFFVLAYSIILISGILYIAPLELGISTISISLDNLKIGGVVEMFILTYAVSYRMKVLYQENEGMRKKLQDFMNQGKEQKFVESGQPTQNPALLPHETTLNDRLQWLAEEYKMTEREVQVLMCITRGLNNASIAQELSISVNTVKYHTRNIYEKLNISSRGEAISKVTITS